MKTNLLKMAIGAFFSLAMLSAANVNAQITAYDNFEYPVDASYQGVAGSGMGWAGPWDGQKEGTANGGGFHNAIAGNLEGTIGVTGAIGGQWVDSYRDLAVPMVNEPGEVVWIGFTYKGGRPGTGTGVALFWGGTENVYIGRVPTDVIGIGNCYTTAALAIADPAGDNGTRADANGIVLSTDKHYYLTKVTGQGNGIIRIDLWADYEGTTPPLADFDEPTYQAFGYRNSAGGIDKIRISGGTEPSEAATLYSTFDAIRFSSTFFRRCDITLNGSQCLALPLDELSLDAKSTASGNLVTWAYSSNDKVASISVLRKDASGAFVAISNKLGANAKSFLDTNPLDGTNYYKLSSTDNDGKVINYDPIATAKGFEVEPTFFPNPSTGGVVNVVAGNGAVKSVSIFDLTGKKVASKAGAGAVSTSSLAKGVYIIEITSDKSTTRNKLVVE